MRNVVYIDRNYLYFYGNNVHAPIPLQFQPTTVKDMELINYEELEKQIDALIKTNKIEPDELEIVIAHQSSFEKIIPPKIVGVELENEKKKFLDNVPFEDIMYKEFPSSAGIKLIAVNKELFYAIKEIFQNRGFKIVAITSIAALYPEADVAFNVALAQKLLQKSAVMNQATFPVEDIEVPSTDTYDESNKPEKNNNRLFLLVGVFVILIGSLTALLLLRNRSSAKTVQTTPTPIPVASPTVAPQITPSPQTTVLPSIPPSIKSGLTIQILNGSGVAGQADELGSQLEENGYTNITTGNTQTLQSSRSLVVFKPSVSEQVRNDIITLITATIGEATVQESSQITSDVVITTARNNSPSNTPTP